MYSAITEKMRKNQFRQYIIYGTEDSMGFVFLLGFLFHKSQRGDVEVDPGRCCVCITDKEHLD